MVRQSGQSQHDGAVSRALHELGAEARGTASRQADHRHRPIGLGPVSLQPPSPRTRPSRARGNSRSRRHCLRVSGASDPGNRQAPDRRARPQPLLPRAGGNPVRLFHRRRRAHHRLRQDHPGATDGGGDRRHPGHRALRRADAERLVPRRAHRLRHHRLEGARIAGDGRNQRRGVHRADRVLRAVGGPLQHHGHGIDHELAGGSARHVPARRRGDSGPAQGSRGQRVRKRQAHRRDGVGRPAPVEDHDPRGVRERHRRQLRDRRLDQCADPFQRHRAPYRRQARQQRLGKDRLRHSAAGEPAAGRRVPRRGIPPRRRRAGGGQRTDQGRQDPQERADRQRQDAVRELQEDAGPGRAGDLALQASR